MKAINASANESVSVTMTSVKHAKAHAPTGNGLRMRPEIVVRKNASSCHACVVTLEGLGIAKRTKRPIDMENNSGRNLARPSERVIEVRKLVWRRVGVCGGVEWGTVMMELSSAVDGDVATVVEKVCISLVEITKRKRNYIPHEQDLRRVGLLRSFILVKRIEKLFCVIETVGGVFKGEGTGKKLQIYIIM